MTEAKCAMGEIVVRVELENSTDRDLFERGHGAESDIRGAAIDAVADTGAVMLALPEDVVAQLGLREVSRIATTYADGRQGELPVVGPISIRIGNRQMLTEALVIPSGADPLVGQIVLERLDLIADSLNQRLSPRPESPDRPLLRV